MKNPNMPSLPLRNPLINLNKSRSNGSPLRRSILIATTAVSPTNRDEEERIERRNNAEIQRRISSIGLNRSMTGETSELSDSKMQDHFQQCVRLFAENKINSKNAWSLQIIEYMRRLLDRDQFEMGDSLQIASTSLDIGSKVYGLRVDDIHNEIMKLAANMARINLEHERSADNVEENGPESGDEDAAAAQQQKKKEKRKKRSSTGDENSQLVTNEDSISGKLPTIMFYNRQEGTTRRLYTLAALHTFKCGDEQLVSGRSKVPYWSILTDTINVRPVSGLVAVNIPPANGTICPSFTDFSVDQWAPEDDLVDVSRATLHEVVYDENGWPVPELDNNDDDADDGGDDVEEEFVADAHADGNTEVTHITDMRPGAVSSRLEYSYREAPVISERYMLTGVWAGPSHWKVKCVQRTATATIVKNARVVRKRAPRAAPTAIDFTQSDDDFRQLIKENKGTLTKTLQDEYRITYPEDMRITQGDIRSLFLKPGVHVAMPANVQHEEPAIDHDITNYEYDNPNDAEYCNETLHGDALDADSDAEPPADAHNDSCFGENNMVNMPNMVQKSHVAYATQAKKVDMKKLKKAIIKTMARLDVQNSQMNDNQLDHCKIHKVSFCKMYNELPNELNSRMAEEISAPLAFVALLHLCNERNLQLDGQDDLLDVLISSN